jgi:hypothetical protein
LRRLLLWWLYCCIAGGCSGSYAPPKSDMYLLLHTHGLATLSPQQPEQKTIQDIVTITQQKTLRRSGRSVAADRARPHLNSEIASTGCHAANKTKSIHDVDNNNKTLTLSFRGATWPQSGGMGRQLDWQQPIPEFVMRLAERKRLRERERERETQRERSRYRGG